MATKCKSGSEALPSTHPRCMYDTLLETFLPVIHKAAYSASAPAHPDTSGDLLLAGLRGLKEAIVQFSDVNQSIPQNIIEQTIHASMQQQLKSTRHYHDQNRSGI